MGPDEHRPHITYGNLRRSRTCIGCGKRKECAQIVLGKRTNNICDECMDYLDRLTTEVVTLKREHDHYGQPQPGG